MEYDFNMTTYDRDTHTPLICADCGGPAEGEITCDGDEICNACHASYLTPAEALAQAEHDDAARMHLLATARMTMPRATYLRYRSWAAFK